MKGSAYTWTNITACSWIHGAWLSKPRRNDTIPASQRWSRFLRWPSGSKLKPRSHPSNGVVAFLERWKKFITARYRSKNVGHRNGNAVRIRSVTAYGPSYRFESFELHKYCERWERVFSAPAKCTAVITTLSQSLAPLDASSWLCIAATKSEGK